MSTPPEHDLMCGRCNMPVLNPTVRVDKDGHPLHESCYVDDLLESMNQNANDTA